MNLGVKLDLCALFVKPIEKTKQYHQSGNLVSLHQFKPWFQKNEVYYTSKDEQLTNTPDPQETTNGMLRISIRATMMAERNEQSCMPLHSHNWITAFAEQMTVDMILC